MAEGAVEWWEATQQIGVACSSAAEEARSAAVAIAHPAAEAEEARQGNNAVAAAAAAAQNDRSEVDGSRSAYPYATRQSQQQVYSAATSVVVRPIRKIEIFQAFGGSFFLKRAVG